MGRDSEVQTIELDMSEEFSFTPGPRSRDEGPFSGDQLLEELLEPKYASAVKEGKKLLVNLDGTAGFATSFLEAAFGGLARIYDQEQVLETLLFQTAEEPHLEEEIRSYIRNARGKDAKGKK